MNLRAYLDTNVFVYGLLEDENLEFLVAYDGDYEGVPEYITPKDFIERLGIREYDMEY